MDDSIRRAEKRFRATSSSDDELTLLKSRCRSGAPLDVREFRRLHTLDKEAATEHLRWRAAVGLLSPALLRAVETTGILADTKSDLAVSLAEVERQWPKIARFCLAPAIAAVAAKVPLDRERIDALGLPLKDIEGEVSEAAMAVSACRHDPSPEAIQALRDTAIRIRPGLSPALASLHWALVCVGSLPVPRPEAASDLALALEPLHEILSAGEVKARLLDEILEILLTS